MKKLLNSAGFSVVATALIVVVIGIIVGTGYYVYNAQKETKKLLDNASSTAPVTNNKTATQPDAKSDDPTSQWKIYKSDSGEFSVKFPKTWVTASNLEYCSEGLLLIGVNMKDGTSSVGRCGSDGAGAFGQMVVTWTRDKDRADMSRCGFTEGAWKVDSKSSVKVAGVNAIRTAATFTIDESEMGGESKGTTSVQYCFIAKDTLYIASYTMRPNYPDALNDFDAMVTKTFTIN